MPTDGRRSGGLIGALLPVVGADATRRLRGALTGIAVAAILEAACFALLVPLLVDLFADRFPRAWWWAGMFVVAAALALALERRALRTQRAVTTDVVATLHHRVGDHVMTLPLGWFTPAQQDALNRLLTEATTSLAVLLNAIAAINVRAIATAAALWMVIAVVDLPTAAVAAVGLVLLAIVYRLAARLLRAGNRGTVAATQEIGAQVLEFAQQQPVLRAHGRLGDANTELRAALEQMRSAASTYFRGAIIGVTAFSVGTAILLGGVLGIAWWRLGLGEITVAVAVGLVVLAALIVDAVAALGRTGSVIWASEQTLQEIGDILHTEPLAEPVNPVAITDSSVEFRNVTFRYHADTAVIDDASVRIPPGGVCAVVGPSGSGKTTLVRLAARFFDVDAGQVLVGGVDVRDLRTADLMAQISVVFQDVYLFDGTIRDNVLMGRPDADDADLVRIARLARLDEIVDRLPFGWETPVGDRGTALSGGERQRVSIARALLKDAPVVLLDEATSALDPENEAAVRDALRHLGDGRTRLIIAHRLQTVRAADQIVFLDGGTVGDVGTHDELLSRSDRYVRFWHEHRSGDDVRVPDESPADEKSIHQKVNHEREMR
ncbi:ABC transporter ATP-binding protein [Gordonia insulae]|uniref:Iron import ATP-binding/permease protein IrtB n=1 Tax=Gordonia insulae TaxID=2420509 RepID=A0A3G8JKS8_9ACTN|nr:ABC transporter ATP-binding protein [Gordonia insulae]AZG45039.1 Iron import ATP-binding/permease protein IrtB [Gordonia insulae]